MCQEPSLPSVHNPWPALETKTTERDLCTSIFFISNTGYSACQGLPARSAANKTCKFVLADLSHGTRNETEDFLFSCLFL